MAKAKNSETDYRRTPQGRHSDQQGTVLLVPRRVYLRAAADGTGHRHGLRSGQADPVDIRLINNLKVKVHD